MHRTKHWSLRKARSEGILYVQKDECTFGYVSLNEVAYKIVLLYDHEELLEHGASSANVGNGADTHTHAVDGEPGKATTMCGDDSVAEIVAETMPNVSAHS